MNNKNSYEGTGFLIIVLLIFIIIAISLVCFYKKDSFTSLISKETFKTIPQGGLSGFGFQQTTSDYPLFLNFYPPNLGQDFNLSGIIQKLRFYNQMFPTGVNGYQRGVFTQSGHGQSNMGRAMCPIILVPGLGASTIYGQWNKTLGTPDVKIVDAFGNFEVSQKWRCRTSQQQWTKLWFPDDLEGLGQYCWQDNISVYYSGDGGTISNSEGVVTTTPHFGDTEFQPMTYMNTLIRALEALGYQKGSTLFGACYDFRTICSQDQMSEYRLSLQKLIERSVSINRRKAILIGHSLGANLVNYILSTSDKKWKDTYIQCFVSFSGAFVGCPKALRVLLSGETLPSKHEQRVIRDATVNFTGLQWMLPNPNVYRQIPLVHHRQITYKAQDIPELMRLSDKSSTKSSSVTAMSSDIYNNIIRGIQEQTLMAPQVPVYVMAGTGLNTESSYMYQNSLFDNPVKNYPFYQTDMANNNHFDYPENFNGDGTIPKFALEYPKIWSRHQQEPVFYRSYNRAEHTKIMSMAEPIKDLLEVIKEFNN